MSADDIIARFINTNRFYAVYPTALLTGLFFRSVVSESLYTYLQSTYWVSSKNIVNKTFAHRGNDVFLVIFVALCLLKLYQHWEHQAPKEAFTYTTLIYTTRLALKYCGLWALFYIIDHLFLATGGSCLVTPEFADVLGSTLKAFEDCFKVHGTWVRLNEGFCSLTPAQFSQTVTSAERCYEVGRWEGGFDVSGHYCFLMTLSLIFWSELKRLQNESGVMDLEAQKSKTDTWFKMSPVNAWRWTVIIVLSIWVNMLFVTAMFYHTLLEKITGLMFGYLTPVVIYELLPDVSIGRIHI